MRALAIILGIFFLLALGGAVGSGYVLYRYGYDLPDYKQLAVYEPPLMTRVHAADGRLLAEYARERRLFVPINAIPPRVIDAFLAAEDKNFYSHPGIDALGVVRAVLTNLQNYGKSRRPVGASTITQQVAKNFLLTNEPTLDRKIREAILAFRIEHAFTKDQILELYLNQIYLGLGSYGVAAAALNYFNKSLDDLTLAETAYLAALPKAPNNYHPTRRPEAAVARRNWVLERMIDGDFLAEEAAEEARSEPIIVQNRESTEFVTAEYFAEEVRRQLYAMYGESGLYEGGLSVRTTLDPALQNTARKTLRDGLLAYDRRHGWRGPVAHIEMDDDWRDAFRDVVPPRGLGPWSLAVVVNAGGKEADITLADGSAGYIRLEDVKWARPWKDDQTVGAVVRRVSKVLKPGDVIAVEPLVQDGDGAPQPGVARKYALRQIPDAQGAVLAMDPHTGRVLAMVGGYDYRASEFNRAVQAQRQPGSDFKPFVYVSALENGFTPSNLILDEPFVIDQGPGMGKWRPANYTKKFYGPSTLRLGIEKSRNLMTVRLAQYIGMEDVVASAKRFGVVDSMPPILSMALGAGETTLLRLTAAYASLVNGGMAIEPTLIDRIQDRRGANIYRHDVRPCEGCAATAWRGQGEPVLADTRERIVGADTAYQMVSMLKGVVDRGTGVRVRAVGKPLAGKTGTSNESRDTWFMGFTPDLVVGIFVGFDTPRTLGPRESGSSVTAPMFRDFMMEALAREPSIPFRVPPGIRLVRVNARTGLPAEAGDRRVILEAFKPGTEPTGQQSVLDGSGAVASNAAEPRSGTGGLY